MTERISPNDVLVILHVTDTDDQQTILATIDRMETTPSVQ